jgi:hypothetical protein
MGAEVNPPPLGNEPSDILSEDKEALADELADYTDDMPDSYYLLCDASAKVRRSAETNVQHPRQQVLRGTVGGRRDICACSNRYACRSRGWMGCPGSPGQGCR